MIVNRDLLFEEYTKRSIGGILTLVRKIALPTWNMDSTGSITLTFGTDLGVKDIKADGYLRIENAWCKILNDSALPSISYKDIYFDISTTTLTINRVAGGKYDTTDFDSTASSRGCLYLELAI